MKWSILLASPAGGAVSDREKGVRRERRGRTTNGSGVRDPWCGRRILCDQSETPRVADSVRSTLPALVVAFMAPTCGLGFGFADPPGDLLVDPFRGHLSDYLLITIFFLW